MPKNNASFHSYAIVLSVDDARYRPMLVRCAPNRLLIQDQYAYKPPDTRYSVCFWPLVEFRWLQDRYAFSVGRLIVTRYNKDRTNEQIQLMELTEQQLADAICEHDGKALEKYLQIKRSALLTLIRRSMSTSLAQKIEPQDIFQEVAIHAFNGLCKVDLTSVSPYAWLCRLAEQRIIDAHRYHFGAGKRSTSHEVGLYDPRSPEQSGAFLDILVASLTTPTQFVTKDEKMRALVEQFDRLSVDIREVVNLRYVNGLTLREIAIKTDKSEGAVRVMLSRGLKKLRKSMIDQ